VSISKPPVQVLLGAVDLSAPGQFAQTYHVQKIIQHPEYAAATMYNDIALLELNRTVKFSQHVQPACLYTESDVSELVLEVTGWGATSNSRKFMRAWFQEILIL
jgi:secreted trypsin-like serine protease